MFCSVHGDFFSAHRMGHSLDMDAVDFPWTVYENAAEAMALLILQR